MLTLLAVIESSILLILALLHFYWAAGGEWGFDAALPSKENGEKLFVPGKMDAILVGVGLLSFALFFVVKAALIVIPLHKVVMNYGGWAIAVIFLLRAIGEFRYVGFFKKIRNSDFARMDTRYYAPLCLFLALNGFLIALFGSSLTS